MVDTTNGDGRLRFQRDAVLGLELQRGTAGSRLWTVGDTATRAFRWHQKRPLQQVHSAEYGGRCVVSMGDGANLRKS